MKKVFKQLHNLAAKNQLKQRFGEGDKVEHFVFITKQKESDVRFHGCYQDEELPKMLFAVADENPEFLEAMKKAVKEVEERKIVKHTMFGGGMFGITMFDDLEKILKPTIEPIPRRDWMNGGFVSGADNSGQNADRHVGIVAELKRLNEERAKEMVLRKKPCPVLPSGTVYHETSPSDIIDVNDKSKKYFFFHDKEKRQAFYLTNENERKFAIDDKRKVYWLWR